MEKLQDSIERRLLRSSELWPDAKQIWAHASADVFDALARKGEGGTLRFSEMRNLTHPIWGPLFFRKMELYGKQQTGAELLMMPLREKPTAKQTEEVHRELWVRTVAPLVRLGLVKRSKTANGEEIRLAISQKKAEKLLRQFRKSN